jgi:hypothetical protein
MYFYKSVIEERQTFLLSIINYQLSIINYQLSIINYFLNTFPSAIFPAVNGKERTKEATC